MEFSLKISVDYDKATALNIVFVLGKKNKKIVV